MQRKCMPLQKEALKLAKYFDLDQIMIVGQKKGVCEFAASGNSISNFAMTLETLRFMLKEEKEFIKFFKQSSFLGMLLIDKLFEADYLIERYIGNDKEVTYN